MNTKPVSIIQLRNFFLNATNSSQKRMNSMLRDHLDKLARVAASNPSIDAIYQSLLPIANAYVNAYNAVQSNAAFYEGRTSDFTKMITDLSGTHIRRWDVAIQNVFDIETGDYISLLPNGRYPFQHGTYEARLGFVGSLLANLRTINHPDLATLITTIDNWLTQANALRSTQQGLEGQDSQLRKAAEDARVAVAEAMHKAFFQLCVHYFPDLGMIETFYETKYFRSTTVKSPETPSPNSNEVSISAFTRKTVLTGTFDSSHSFDLSNTGNTRLYVWLSSNEHSELPADATVLESQAASNFLAEELSDGSASFQFLIVYNPSDTENGRIKVAVLNE
jgi:hypothetical protein